MTPFFSIIIPVYNVAPYLRECLDSVLAQTFTDWEAICVDDGSTDGSGAILDEYAAKDKRFKVVHQANAGVSAARNKGLDVAQGEWIWFVDGDDAIHVEALSYVRFLQQQSMSNAYIFNRFISDVTVGTWNNLSGSKWEKTLDHNVKNFSRFHFCIWNVVFEKSIAASVRFEPYRYGEDTLFLSEIFWRIRTFVFDEAQLYFYRVRDDSATGRSATFEMASQYVQVMFKWVTEIHEHKLLCSKKENMLWPNAFKDYLLAGHKHCFLRLPDDDWNDLLVQWRLLQEKVILTKSGYKYLPILLLMLRFFHSGRIIKKLIVLQMRVKDASILELTRKVFRHLIKK